VDTHGLAQRGGIVVSQIRMGDTAFSPLIPRGQADLAVSLERHEALRAAATMLKKNRTLVYYNAVWQPLSVRLGETPEVVQTQIQEVCRSRGIGVVTVFDANLPDIRMQNMVVLSAICRRALIPGIVRDDYLAAMRDLMEGEMLQRNLSIFTASC
jgi:indolepyruvate ferredoxin oxidoreductase beta subunit